MNLHSSLRSLRLVAVAGALHGAVMVAVAAAPRPPAVPLVAHDPYLSIWSFADAPTDADTVHWTGQPMPLRCVARIDGQLVRLLGKVPGYAPPARLKDCRVRPTQTTYEFDTDAVVIRLSFTTPAIADDVALMARPITYLDWEFSSRDGRAHAVDLYLSVSARLAVNDAGQAVVLSRGVAAGLTVLRVGTERQPILERAGDDVRIDWGHAYLAVPADAGAQTSASSHFDALTSFYSGQALPPDVGSAALRVRRNEPVLAVAWPAGAVKAGAPLRRRALLGYDDVYAVEYFGERLRGYWTRETKDFAELLGRAARDADAIIARCARFDEQVWAATRAAGGDGYAELCALAYRQSVAAHKLVARADGALLSFSKENFSNGCMGTVDVFYPAAPVFLALNPELIKAQTTPLFDYAASGRWPWPYAPHDLGRYPKANGQVYGGGEKSEDRQMPVEECGNMMLLAAAIAKAEGRPDYATRYWPILTKWAGYLRAKGFDPENQLCTDDFAGHLARNANLSLKAITALAAYGQLCAARGDAAAARSYQDEARALLGRWRKEAATTGRHFALAFGQPDTWSLKYNLVWDRLLGLGLDSDDIFAAETAHYRRVQGIYGVPLDNRSAYTKLDWILWYAAVQPPADFEALLNPVRRFLQETPDRVPMTDWYWTHTGEMTGFQARSVVGGVFMRLWAHQLGVVPKATQ